MQSTPNYNYNLPEYSDSADIAVLNANFSSIDANEYRIEGKLNALGNDIALPYDNTATYSVGDYVTYNNKTYRCITAIATAEDFDSTKWTAITIGGELKSHDTRISTLEAGVDLEKSATNSFTDGIDSLFKKVVSSIVPVQAGSGTPSPTNVRAISGFTGCAVLDRGINQWDEQWESGAINPATGNKITSPEQIRTKNYIKIKPNAYYYTKSSGGIWCIFYDENYQPVSSDLPTGQSSSDYGRLLQNMSWKAPATAKYMLFYLVKAYGTTYKHDISVNYPATDTDYHAYTATTATISFGSAGTVYGGYVDLISGKLVVDRALIKGGWTQFKSNNNFIAYRQTMPYFGKYGGYVAISNITNVISSFNSDNMTYNVIQPPTSGTRNSYMALQDDFDQNDVELLYEIATPQEYQLTPTQLRSLVGANRLTSSTGEVTEVEYITNKTIAWLLDLIRAQEV